MKGDRVPNTAHITRYCSGGRVKRDGSISGEAFRLRQKAGYTEEYLSVNWLEHLGKHSREEEIAEIQAVLAAKLTGGIRPSARIALLNVGETLDRVRDNSEDSRNLQVLHEPESGPPPDPSHSGIHGLRLEDALIGDLIAMTVKEVHPAKGT